jgi:hypothetical protein
MMMNVYSRLCLFHGLHTCILHHTCILLLAAGSGGNHHTAERGNDASMATGAAQKVTLLLPSGDVSEHFTVAADNIQGSTVANKAGDVPALQPQQLNSGRTLRGAIAAAIAAAPPMPELSSHGSGGSRGEQLQRGGRTAQPPQQQPQRTSGRRSPAATQSAAGTKSGSPAVAGPSGGGGGGGRQGSLRNQAASTAAPPGTTTDAAAAAAAVDATPILTPITTITTASGPGSSATAAPPPRYSRTTNERNQPCQHPGCSSNGLKATDGVSWYCKVCVKLFPSFHKSMSRCQVGQRAVCLSPQLADFGHALVRVLLHSTKLCHCIHARMA